MKIKNNVSLRNLEPHTVLGLIICEGIAPQTCIGGEMTITSLHRLKGPGSLHPYGYAVDFVIEGATRKECVNILPVMRNKLGGEYDLIFHNAGTGWHFHLEYDPR